MLRNYGVVIPEESLVQLQELPEKWANTKRLSVTAKQQVAPLQSMEVGKLKRKINEFEARQVEFRKSFQGMRFHAFKCQRPYELLAEANKKIDTLEVEMKTLQVIIEGIFGVIEGIIFYWLGPSLYFIRTLRLCLKSKCLSSVCCSNAAKRSRC